MLDAIDYRAPSLPRCKDAETPPMSTGFKLAQFRRVVLEPPLFRSASACGTACIQAAECLSVVVLNTAKSEGCEESRRG